MTRRIPITLLTAAMLALLVAAPARAQMTASELMTRLDQIEAQLRALTGTVEQLQFRNNQLEQQLRALQEGARPATARNAPPPQLPPLQQAQPAPQIAQPLPQPVPPAPAPAQRRSDAFDPNQNPNAPGSPLDLSTLSAQAAEEPGPAPRPAEIRNIPGVLPAPPPRNPSATGNTQVVMAPTQTPKDEYDLAYGYMQRKDYALAEQALRGFLAKYPSDHQVADATYWLGESMFQRQRYRESAEVFLSVTTKFGTSGKAPEAMLRLGQSLAALKEKETACAALGEIPRKYPRAATSIKNAEREQKRIGC